MVPTGMRKQISLQQFFLVVVAWGLLWSPASGKTEDIQNYAMLLDMSASMLEPLDGTPKYKLAQQALKNLEEALLGQTNISLIYFANGTDQQNDAANCLSSRQVIRNGEAVTLEHVSTVVHNLGQPEGRKTNIAHAIEIAAQELKTLGGGKIILISDGNENCELNPVELARELQAANIPIDTIGIGNAADFSELGRIALAGGGTFQLANSAIGLAEAISNAAPMSGAVGAGPQAMSVDAGSQQIPAMPAPATEPMVLEMDVNVAEEVTLPVAVEIILDVSGSMAGRLQGIPKMTLARQALSEALLGLESTAFAVGFRAYGFDHSVAKTAEASCPNTVLLNPVARNQIPGIRTQVGGLIPYGYTPLAKSLELAGEDLLAVESDKQMIILLTDGEESCGGDPESVAANLRRRGIDVEVHIVGFDLTAEEATVMKDVAVAGGGAYYDAHNVAELSSALSQVIEVTANKVDPDWLRTISPVIGGKTPSEAVLLAPGTYTLTAHLPKGEEMFFRVTTARGQHGVVRGLIQSRRLIREGDTRVESDLGYAQYAIRLYEADGGKIGGRTVRLHGEPGSFGHVGYSDLLGNGFIFSISSNYDQVHKDALFNIEVTDASDQYVGVEASEQLTKTTPTITLNTPTTGHLGDGDRKDVYKVELGEATSVVTINLNFREPDFVSRVMVKGLSRGRKIQSAASRGDAYALVVDIPEAETEGLMIEIKSNNPALKEKFSSYELAVTTKDVK
tara:strand:+ start:389109 stop:391319 length:2211 start_codon:yes stop_codon:yes gene_type:complete